LQWVLIFTSEIQVHKHYLYSFCTGNGRAPATEYQNLTSLYAELVNGFELSCGL